MDFVATHNTSATPKDRVSGPMVASRHFNTSGDHRPSAAPVVAAAVVVIGVGGHRGAAVVRGTVSSFDKQMWWVPDAPAVSGVGGVYTLGVINLVDHGGLSGWPKGGPFPGVIGPRASGSYLRVRRPG